MAEVDQVRDLQTRSWRIIWWQRWNKWDIYSHMLEDRVAQVKDTYRKRAGGQGGRDGTSERPTDKELEDMVAEVDQVRDKTRSWRTWWQRWTR